MDEYDEVEIEFGGLRFRTLAVLPPGAVMICDALNKPAAIYSPEKGWRSIDPETLQRATQVLFSPEGITAIAREVMSPPTASGDSHSEGEKHDG